MPLDLSFLDPLDQVPWPELEHAYGPAEDTAQLLRALADESEEVRERAFNDLSSTVYHQGTVYAASVEAVPFLVRMAETPNFPAKFRVLYLLNLLYHGTSFHDVHRGGILMPGSGTPEYEALVQTELGWVKEIQSRVRQGLPAYLALLADESEQARLYAQLLLSSLGEDAAAIREAASATLPRETHLLCRAGLVQLLGLTGEPILPRWQARLKDEPPLIRLVAAMQVLRQEGEKSPPEVVDLVLGTMTHPDRELAGQYAELPMTGSLVGDLGSVLTWGGHDAVRAGLEAVLANLDADERGDYSLERVRAMLTLACCLTRSNPFREPASLSGLQRRAAEQARRQLHLMLGYINLYHLLSSFGLPDNERQFDDYLRARGS